MKLSIEFQGNSKGYSKFDVTLACDILEDAEALGYTLGFMTALTDNLKTLVEATNPKYKDRLLTGLSRALYEKRAEQNPNWPFQNITLRDEQGE